MVIFNLFKKKEKRTGPITPKYNGVIPPMPSIKVPKADNPKGRPTPPSNPFKGKLDPPFDAATACEQSKINYYVAEKRIKDYVWNDIADAIKKGKTNVHVSLSYFHNQYFSDEINQALSSVGKDLSKIMKEFGKELVSLGYSVRGEDHKAPKFYTLLSEDGTRTVIPYTKPYYETEDVELFIFWNFPNDDENCLSWYIYDILYKKENANFFKEEYHRETYTKAQIFEEMRTKCQEIS